MSKNKTNKKTNTNEQGEISIVPSETLRVEFERQGPGKGLRKFVHTQGVIAGDICLNLCHTDAGTMRGIVDGITNGLRAGYEVRIGLDEANCIRLYPCLDISTNQIYIAARTMGDLRDICADMEWKPYRKSEPTTMAKIKKEDTEAKKEARACVSPDTVVKCPNCGTEFRVGRVLAEETVGDWEPQSH